MNNNNSIKQCVLIGQSITSDYETASIFTKIGATPIIDLCINWLCDNGIKEIFLFYSKSKVDIQQFHRLYETNPKAQAKIHLNYIKPEEFKNFGDVMREIQFRNIISQDFVILFADTISNLDLNKAITTHFRKKAELKSVVLTTILRDNSHDGKIHVTSAETGQILQMDQDTGGKFTINKQRINLKKINVEFRRDLTHCDIYICTVDVFKSFKQNYEYATMFDFINGMLTSEVYEQKIVGHVLESQEHTFRINKTKDFYLAYIHYIADHFYPYTLANKIKHYQSHKSAKAQETKFVTKNFNKIIFNGSSIPKSTFISNNCYIGQNCLIDTNVQIEKSILTSSCQISNKATLRNCLILEGCTIAQKASFDNCLIQKVNETQQIRRFSIFPKFEVQIINEPLFEVTPPPQQSTFQEQMRQVLDDDPRLEIVNELNSIRKHHNKSLQQFTKQMISTIKPQGQKGVQSFSKGWGQILQKIHENQQLLMDSLYFSCTNIPDYNKAFHVFLQYFYNFDWLKSFAIQQWYEDAVGKYIDSPALQKCQKFINMLKEEDQQEQESEEEASQGSQGSHKSDSNSEQQS